MIATRVLQEFNRKSVSLLSVSVFGLQLDFMIKAILFDLDGVFVDTLHYHYLAWKKMLEEIGGTVSEHTILLHEGRNSREILPLLLSDAGIALPEDKHQDFIDRKREYYRSIVDVRHFPNALPVMETLKARGFKTALVTACALRNMEASLDAEQRGKFDFVITGDEVPRAKPFPDPYLAAMRQLDLTPEECIVVENAPLGIESAKAAGMQCIAIETTLGREYLTLADLIIHDIGELLDLPLLKTPGAE
jgi:beta-phosphoglucomutase